MCTTSPILDPSRHFAITTFSQIRWNSPSAATHSFGITAAGMCSTCVACTPVLHSALLLQASRCFVLDVDRDAFLAAVKDRKATSKRPSPTTALTLNSEANYSSRLATGHIGPGAGRQDSNLTNSGQSSPIWPVGRNVLDFFWGELAISEGAPFACPAPGGKSKVSYGACKCVFAAKPARQGLMVLVVAMCMYSDEAGSGKCSTINFWHTVPTTRFGWLKQFYLFTLHYRAGAP